MFTGFNSDIELDGKVYHIQTEDKGLSNPVLETRVYCGGEVVVSVRTSYADLADSPDYSQERIRRRLQQQHQSLIEDLRAGRLEAQPKIRNRLEFAGTDAEHLTDEYVEDWIETSSVIQPILRALERDRDRGSHTSVVVHPPRRRRKS